MKFLSLLLALMLSMNAFAIRTFTDSALILGPGSAVDIDYAADVDGVDNPKLRYNATTDRWTLSDNGVDFRNFPLDSEIVHTTGNESIAGTKTFTGKTVVQSTTNGATPCPVMTDTQMLAVSSPANGDCVYNSTKKAPYYYNSTDMKWKLAGGGAGGSRLNLLVDGSFEDGVAEGTCSGCTATQESSVVLATPNNEKALKMEFTASTGCYTVDKTTTSNFANVQGLVGAWINTSQAGITLTTRRNGTDTLNVKSIEANGYYTYYEIPDVTGSTSFGYKVCATSSITGNVYVDETFNGPAKVTGSMGLIGPWTTYTPTFTSFGTVTVQSFRWRQVGSSIEVSGRFTAGTTANTEARISFPSGFTSVPSIATLEIAGSGGSTRSDAANSFMYPTIEPSQSYFTFARVINSAAGLTKLNGDSYLASGNSYSFIATVPVNELTSSTNTLSSTNGNYGPIPYTPVITSLSGTLTNYTATATHQRIGNLIYIEGTITFTGAVGTWSSPKISLPTGLTPVLSARAVNLPGGASYYDLSATGTFEGLVLGDSTNGVTLALPAYASVTQASPYAFASGDVITFKFSVPVLQWPNTNSIDASLRDNDKTPDMPEPRTCYLGYGGSSATLTSPTECAVDGACIETVDNCKTATPPTRSGTGNYLDATFANGTFAPNSLLDCTCSSFDVGSTSRRSCRTLFVTGDQTWATNASGGAVLNIWSDGGSDTAQDGYILLRCKAKAP